MEHKVSFVFLQTCINCTGTPGIDESESDLDTDCWLGFMSRICMGNQREALCQHWTQLGRRATTSCELKFWGKWWCWIAGHWFDVYGTIKLSMPVINVFVAFWHWHWKFTLEHMTIITSMLTSTYACSCVSFAIVCVFSDEQAVASRLSKELQGNWRNVDAGCNGYSKISLP